MQTISTKELRDNLAEILERVAVGREEFIVAKFGRKKAILIPVDSTSRVKQKDLSHLSAFGIWKGRGDISDSSKWVSKTRVRQSQRNSP